METEAPKLSLKEEIEMMENELRNTGYVPKTARQNYKDDMGNDTYYVKNMAQGHIALANPDILIKKGEAVDLLELASLDELNSCRDLRTCKNNGTLKQITQIEYAQAIRSQLETKKRIDVLNHQAELKKMQNKNNTLDNSMGNNPAPIEQEQIRPVIASRLHKLSLSSNKDPEINSRGWSSVEFINWMMGESLSIEELDHLLGDPTVAKYHDIKAQIIQKKAMM